MGDAVTARRVSIEGPPVELKGPAYHRVQLHGERAALLWGYHEAAVFKSWRIWKGQRGWQLSGTLARVDHFQARQRPLMFSAPRDKGMWCWGVDKLEIHGTSVGAFLGEPEN